MNVNVITVSREYGAGGGEVVRQLAATLGWALLDRELLHEAAAIEHMPDAELERLDEKAISMADRLRLDPPHQHYIHGLKEAARQAAARGNVILIGRGTRQLLGDWPNAFHLRLVAPKQWRVDRMARLEGCSTEQSLARCSEVDRTRDRFMRYFFGPEAVHPAQYDWVVNSERVALANIVRCLKALVHGEAPEPEAASGDAAPTRVPFPAQGKGRRVLTLSRELGAGDTGFAPTLGHRLGLRVYDRELLEQEAVRLGVSESALEMIDEQPAGIFERFRPGSLHQRYQAALRKLMNELADQGDVLLVGRGGSQFLRDDPRAFHTRLVAPPDIRVRRVMEYRWLREEPARKLIARTDAQRRQFYENCFRIEWSSPLEYHITVNSGRLGPAAVDLVVIVAGHYWGQKDECS
jgi:cytidylate kinase